MGQFRGTAIDAREISDLLAGVKANVPLDVQAFRMGRRSTRAREL